MISKYRTTHLEDWVNDMYRSLSIHTPEDIGLRYIASSLNIHLNLKPIPSMSYEEGKFRQIVVDERISKQEQREDFFHELCHVLRHVGQQYMMPKAFKELQEAQAATFVLYAAMPMHMVMEYDLEDEHVLHALSRDFGVSEKMSRIRLDKFRNRSIDQILKRG